MSATFAYDDQAAQQAAINQARDEAGVVYARAVTLTVPRRSTPRLGSRRAGVASVKTTRVDLLGTESDDALRERCREAIRWVTTLPEGAVSVNVAQGKVTLVGCADSSAQSEAALDAIRHLEGVLEIRNELQLRAD